VVMRWSNDILRLKGREEWKRVGAMVDGASNGSG
jgi:hypothetical protein